MGKRDVLERYWTRLKELDHSTLPCYVLNGWYGRVCLYGANFPAPLRWLQPASPRPSLATLRTLCLFLPPVPYHAVWLLAFLAPLCPCPCLPYIRLPRLSILCKDVPQPCLVSVLYRAVRCPSSSPPVHTCLSHPFLCHGCALLCVPVAWLSTRAVMRWL